MAFDLGKQCLLSLVLGFWSYPGIVVLWPAFSWCVGLSGEQIKDMKLALADAPVDLIRSDFVTVITPISVVFFLIVRDHCAHDTCLLAQRSLSHSSCPIQGRATTQNSKCEDRKHFLDDFPGYQHVHAVVIMYTSFRRGAKTWPRLRVHVACSNYQCKGRKFSTSDVDPKHQ